MAWLAADLSPNQPNWAYVSAYREFLLLVCCEEQNINLNRRKA